MQLVLVVVAVLTVATNSDDRWWRIGGATESGLLEVARSTSARLVPPRPVHILIKQRLRCHPKRPNEHYIKRVVGIEGDVIAPLRGPSRVVVPAGACWVEPDNRTSGEGSTDFGPVCLGLITAKATRVIWPKKRWQRISGNIYDDGKPAVRVSMLPPGFSDPDDDGY
uniref:Mitochondrial inner membrane protease subunit 2 n=1 Tax=Plectus sambesii TaxID=2011161 RepID=A0A914UV48_9BILA